jgi:hypothetical protein
MEADKVIRWYGLYPTRKKVTERIDPIKILEVQVFEPCRGIKNARRGS